jgi:hypothetical protein
MAAVAEKTGGQPIEIWFGDEARIGQKNICGRPDGKRFFGDSNDLVGCGHVGMDGPASPGCRMVARSAAIATMEAGYANSSNRTDLAKNVFQVHGIDDLGQAVLKRKLRRSEVLPFFAGLAPAWLGLKPATRPTIGAEKSPLLNTMSV